MTTILKNTKIKNLAIDGFLSPLDLNPAAAFIENNALFSRGDNGDKLHTQTDDAGTIGIPETFVTSGNERTIERTGAFNYSSYSVGGNDYKNRAASNSAYNFLHNGSDAAFIVLLKLAFPTATQLDGVFSTCRLGVTGAGTGISITSESPRRVRFFIQNDTSLVFNNTFSLNAPSDWLLLSGRLTSTNVKLYDGTDLKLDISGVSGHAVGNAISNLQIWGNTGTWNLDGWGRALYLYDYLPDEDKFMNVLKGLKNNSLGD